MQVLREKIPNYLTFARVLLIPFLIVFCFFESGVKYFTCFIFVAAAITDWLDGYLSRLWNATSKFGALMDPIADKLIVITALALLIDADNIHTIPAIGIMCREVFISGLREFIAKTHEDMPVTKLAKWKTAIQMVAISILMLIPTYSGEANSSIKTLFFLGYFCLWSAFILTFYTGYKYYLAAKDKGLI